MKSRWMVAGLVSALGGVSLAQTGGPIEPPSETDWARRPPFEQVWAAIPRAAETAPYLNGGPYGAPRIWAQLDCAVAADGGLSDCRTLAESRPGLGIGQAAIGLSRLYAVRPQPGARTSVTLRFEPAAPDIAASLPVERPSRDDIVSVWPSYSFEGVKRWIGGVGRFTCLSGPDGKLHDCHVLYSDSGLGPEAMSLAPMFRQTPALKDRQPVTTVTSIGIEFLEPPCPTPRDPNAAQPCYTDLADIGAWAKRHGIRLGEEAIEREVPDQASHPGRWAAAGADGTGIWAYWTGVDWKSDDRVVMQVRLEFYDRNMFTSARSQDDNGRANWERSELFEYQFDCASTRMNRMRRTSYTQQNLGGSVVASEGEAGSHTVASTTMDTILALTACRTRPSADTRMLDEELRNYQGTHAGFVSVTAARAP